MTNEMISILVAVVAVSATLGGLILTGNRGLRQDVAQVEARLREDVKQSESRLREEMGHLRGDLKRLGDRGGAAGAWPSQTGRTAGGIA